MTHANVLAAHATLAVFGAVLTTVYGALYQLRTMFTQTELQGVDHRLRSLEELGHPLGVVLLTIGRLTGGVSVARVGGVVLLAAALGFGVVLVRKLYGMQVERTPMHVRYAVVVLALELWVLVTLPAWIVAPLDRIHLFGGAGTVHLFVLGVIGFVVLGTLYHIIPFIVWVHRYSDELGFKDVPMIDDLYDDRLATIDGVFVFAGTAVLVGTDVFDLPSAVAGVGGVSVGLGMLVFSANMLLVVRHHSPHALDRVVLGSLSPRSAPAHAEETSAPDHSS